MSGTKKIAIRQLDSKQLGWLGYAWWDVDSAPRSERASMRRDNANTLAELVGKRFYLIERERLYAPLWTRYALCERPGRTNMSHDARVVGWLGATDNISNRALGYFEVVGQSRTHLHLRDITTLAEQEGMR